MHFKQAKRDTVRVCAVSGCPRGKLWLTQHQPPLVRLRDRRWASTAMLVFRKTQRCGFNYNCLIFSESTARFFANRRNWRIRNKGIFFLNGGKEGISLGQVKGTISVCVTVGVSVVVDVSLSVVSSATVWWLSFQWGLLAACC